MVAKPFKSICGWKTCASLGVISSVRDFRVFLLWECGQSMRSRKYRKNVPWKAGKFIMENCSVSVEQETISGWTSPPAEDRAEAGPSTEGSSRGTSRFAEEGLAGYPLQPAALLSLSHLAPGSSPKLMGTVCKRGEAVPNI